MSFTSSDVIREKFEAKPPPFGRWRKVDVLWNAQCQPMLCRKKSDGADDAAGVIEVMYIKQGRMLSYLPEEALEHTFQINSKNEVRQRTVGVPADNTATLLWLTHGLPIVPNMRLHLEDAIRIHRCIPRDDQNPLQPSAQVREACRQNPLSFVVETTVPRTGYIRQSLYVAKDDGRVLNVCAGEWLPSDNDLLALIVSAVSRDATHCVEADVSQGLFKAPVSSLRQPVAREVVDIQAYKSQSNKNREADDTRASIGRVRNKR